MKLISLILLLFFITGCAKNFVAIDETTETASDIVCAKLSDGSKQTFPSIEIMQQTEGATYLYDGPCYDY